ncbi:MAG: signal recognition particle-docking protein FtsY, partial [Gammaproteobacteria bacterium]|nr:signal recognition particle-docking protein FtsY [Gammaproteobacteria bacterium]
GVSGLCITKLDGTAKGGVIFAIAERLTVPIRYIGVGEGLEDLKPFEAGAFVRALLAH